MSVIHHLAIRRAGRFLIYIGSMTARRIMDRATRKAGQDEVLVVGRPPRCDADRVAFQWHDGAGELHFEVLSPAQSWPFLRARRLRSAKAVVA